VPQWLVTARDGADAGAPARRAAVRPRHLENIAPMVADGRVVHGGAILNAAGAMVGSMMVVEFADRAALDAWLQAEPYITGGVWREVRVEPFRTAVRSPT
jgi:uncharacterized protein